jgi:hypothetical protein
MFSSDEKRNSHRKVYFSSSFCSYERIILFTSECWNIEIKCILMNINSLLNSYPKNVLIRCTQEIVTEKYISHRHFEDFARKFCSYELIILFTSECWDIEIKFRFINVNSLLNSYSKKCSHQLQIRNSHRKVYGSLSFWRLLQ